jgi:hypothetical protein
VDAYGEMSPEDFLRMLEGTRMTMTSDEIHQQEQILQEIIRRHVERQDQMRKDEELAR